MSLNDLPQTLGTIAAIILILILSRQLKKYLKRKSSK